MMSINKANKTRGGIGYIKCSFGKHSLNK